MRQTLRRNRIRTRKGAWEILKVPLHPALGGPVVRTAVIVRDIEDRRSFLEGQQAVSFSTLVRPDAAESECASNCPEQPCRHHRIFESVKPVVAPHPFYQRPAAPFVFDDPEASFAIHMLPFIVAMGIRTQTVLKYIGMVIQLRKALGSVQTLKRELKHLRIRFTARSRIPLTCLVRPNFVSLGTWSILCLDIGTTLSFCACEIKVRMWSRNLVTTNSRLSQEGNRFCLMNSSAKA